MRSEVEHVRTQVQRFFPVTEDRWNALSLMETAIYVAHALSRES